MPTKRQRVAFIPNKRSGEALARLARVSGRSKAAVVADFIEAQAEHIEGIAMACEMVSRLDREAVQLVREASTTATAVVRPALQEVDAAWQRLLDAIEGAKPPAYNMGATSVNGGSESVP